MKKHFGFTLVEILIVIAIIAFLGTIIFVSVRGAYNRAFLVRTKAEIRSIGLALEMFLMDNDYSYPCDVDRNLPPGLQDYLSTKPEWPEAPWPGSVYDWDYWRNPRSESGCKDPNEDPPCDEYCAGNLSDASQGNFVYQLSIRFCDRGDAESCNFPDEEWVKEDWDYNSSIYWCISGPCRSHGSRPYDHPGCCLGGNCPEYAEKCW